MISTKVVVNSNGTQNILDNLSGCKGIHIYYQDNKLIVLFGNGKTWIYLPEVEIEINKKYDICIIFGKEEKTILVNKVVKSQLKNTDKVALSD